MSLLDHLDAKVAKMALNHTLKTQPLIA